MIEQHSFNTMPLILFGLLAGSLLVMLLLAVFLIAKKQWWILSLLASGGLIFLFLVVAVTLFNLRSASVVQYNSELEAAGAAQISDKNRISVELDSIGSPPVASLTRINKDLEFSLDGPSLRSNSNLNTKVEAKATAGFDSESTGDSVTSSDGGNSNENESTSLTTAKAKQQNPKPAWMNQDFYEKDGVAFMKVSSGPHPREKDCQRYLKQAILDAIEENATDIFPDDHRIQRIEIDSEFIENSILVDTYRDEVETTSFGLMPQWHAQLRFDQKFEDMIVIKRNQALQIDRLSLFACIFGIILALLGWMYGLLKIYQVSEGKYASRLQFAGFLAILLSIVGGVLLFQQFPVI